MKFQIDITYNCNMSCKWCNRWCDFIKTDENLSLEQIKKFIRITLLILFIYYLMVPVIVKK